MKAAANCSAKTTNVYLRKKTYEAATFAVIGSQMLCLKTGTYAKDLRPPSPRPANRPLQP
jgi:hypothetical protein